MSIYFQNPGEIDPRLITTLGVNVKESDSPVGFFGTGLKYALAVLLREHHEVTIWSGERRFGFRKVQDVLRGKEFNFIHMSEGDAVPQPLGFTTELGKTWTLANAYRELYCNAKDEGGGVIEEASPTPGHTLIEVSGSAFEQVHLTRDEFLLSPKLIPLHTTQAIQAFPIASNQIFYRGIAAQKIEKTSVLRYNLLDEHALTEDRTIKYPYFINGAIARFITMALADQVALHTILTTDCFEHDLNLAEWDCTWSGHFTAAVRRALREAPTKLDDRITAKFYELNHKGSESTWTEITLTAEQESELSAAKEFLSSCGFLISRWKIIPCEYLGQGVLGLAEFQTNTIRLSAKVFAHPDELVRTLLEEHLHLTFRCKDETRAMQNALFMELHRVSAKLFEYQKKFGLSVMLDDDLPF